MLSEYKIYFILIIYMVLMYAIASWGDRHDLRKNNRLRPWVYGLSLAVYCTSWTFFGAVGSASRSGWDFLPIYLGPLILFTLGWPFINKIVKLSRQNNVTSISDFISSLYNKSRKIAILVTLTALCASIPYITLQLEAITTSIKVISISNTPNELSDFSSALLITVMLAVFSIAFGTKKLDVTEHHRGLMMAIAFESALKILAFMAVALFVFLFIPNSPLDLIDQINLSETLNQGPNLSLNFMSQTLLAFLVFMCLPRQFHVTVVENEDQRDLKPARFIFIVYLLIFSLFVVPIAVTGKQLLGADSKADLFVLQIPLMLEQNLLALFVFLGGLAAATGMVIISTIALSTMISNDIVLPAYLKWKNYHLTQHISLKNVVLWSRRVSIVFISFLSLLFFQVVHNNLPLAALGYLSFVMMVQFAPAMILGMYWKHSSQNAALAGMITGLGLCIWMVTSGFSSHSADQSLMSGLVHGMDVLAQANPPLYKLFGISLGGNILIYISFTLLANIKFKRSHLFSSAEFKANDDLTWGHLKTLVSQVVGEQFAKRSFKQYKDPQLEKINEDTMVNGAMIQFTERLLAGSIGASSARTVVTTLLKRKGLAIAEILALMGETTQALQFNRRLVDATLDNISQGISVVDGDLRLVAWNQQYIELMEFPENFIKRGMHIEEVLKFNAQRGYFGDQDPDQAIEKRLIYLRQRRKHRTERTLSNGRTVAIIGDAMPNGGYLTTYNDVSHYKNIQNQLEQSKQQLEMRVEERTQALSEKNIELADAKQKAELANVSKTKFIADASHDLLQPFNAARLFSSILTEKKENLPEDIAQIVGNLDQSLRSAENLLSSLLDIAKFDAGGVSKDSGNFAVSPLFEHLNNQYQNKAAKKDLQLIIHPSDLWLHSDRKLLFRVLQNLTSNAIKYTQAGRVEIKAELNHGEIEIRIKDSGPGLNEKEKSLIFKEFTRLHNENNTEKGLGLGLSIVERIIRELEIELKIESQPGEGSTFTLTVPAGENKNLKDQVSAPSPQMDQSGLKVLCVDNEPQILEGMSQLLGHWGHEVGLAQCHTDASQWINENGIPQLILMDYQLDDELGTEVLEKLFAEFEFGCPVIMITANHSDELKDQVTANGYQLLQKPIKPIKLRQLMQSIE